MPVTIASREKRRAATREVYASPSTVATVAGGMLRDLRSRQVIRRVARIGGEVGWIGAGQLAGAMGMIVGVRLLTGLMTPVQYGKLALGITFVTLTQQILVSPLGVACQRFFGPSLEENQLSAYLRAAQNWGCRALVVMIGIGAAGVLVSVVGGQRDWSLLIFAALLYALVSGCNSLFSSVQAAARHRPVVAWHHAADQWLRFVCAAALLVLVASSATSALFGYALASVGVLLSQWFLFRRTIASLDNTLAPPDPQRVAHWTNVMHEYMWPFATWGLFTWLHLASSRWALQTFSGPTDVGLHAVLYQIGYYPLSFAAGVLLQFLCPVVFQRAGNAIDQSRVRNVRNLITRVAVVSLLMTFLAFSLTYFLHEIAFSLLVDIEFRQVSHFLPWLVLASGMFLSGQAISVEQMAAVHTRKLIAPKIATAVVGTGLNIAGAWWFGLAGVVFASCAFSTLYLAWMIAIAWGTAGTTHPSHQIAAL